MSVVYLVILLFCYKPKPWPKGGPAWVRWPS